MPRYLLRLLPFLAASLLLAGCIKVDIGIVVNDDGSGTVSLLMAFDESLAQAGGEIDDPFSDLDESELPDGATVEPYEEDGFSGVRVSIPFAAGDNVTESINQAFAGLSDDGNPFAGEEGTFEDLSIVKQDDGGWLFEGTISPDESITQGDPEDPFGAEFAQAILDQLEFTVRITLPGEVIEHNADTLAADGELTWDVDISQPGTLTARTEAGGGGGTPWGLMLGSVAAIALVAVGGLWVLQRSSQPSAPAA